MRLLFVYHVYVVYLTSLGAESCLLCRLNFHALSLLIVFCAIILFVCAVALPSQGPNQSINQINQIGGARRRPRSRKISYVSVRTCPMRYACMLHDDDIIYSVDFGADWCLWINVDNVVCHNDLYGLSDEGPKYL